MASKKDKCLESAQRFMLKGQLDKAIKEYQQVVVLEPKEIRYRQKLAELLVRDSRKDEAIAQYEDVGRHYAENSYFLKAIAVYKQIQRLAPRDIAISLTLASLNHQQGLIGNALAEYGQVVVQLEKEGDVKEAVKVLQQMLLVDGEHAATRLKHAELLLTSGEEDASYQAFSTLLCSLRAKGDDSALQHVSERMRKLFPGQQEPDLDSIAARIAAGDLEGAEDPRVKDGLKRLHEASADPDDFDGLRESELPSAQLPAPEPAVSDCQAMELETSSAFGPAWAAAAEAQSAFGVPLSPEVAGIHHEPSGSETPPELSSPWEEEIELDLGDDFHEVTMQVASSPDASQHAAPSLPLEPPCAADSCPEMDLSLDFSLSLDLEEGEPDEVFPAPETSSLADPPDAPGEACFETGSFSIDQAAVPFGEALPETVELDLDEGAALELLPSEDFHGFGEIEWTEDTEAFEEAQEELEAARSEEAAGLDLPDPGVAPRQLRGWQEIYPGTGVGADKVMDIDELESHYDLGICYKEMGLYNEAIKSFTVAAGNPQRRLDCLTLQAICYREKGEPAKAEDLLQRGRGLEVLSSEERMSLNFELAYLMETTGAVEEAIGLYREVHEANPDFHDVARKLYALSGDEREESFDVIELELEEDDY